MPAEAPSNWLSKIFQEKCGVIDRLIPFVEKKAERDAIVAAVREHPKAGPLADNPNLPDVIWAALGVFNDRVREAKKRPDVMTASPAIQVSWFVFEEFELALPDAEV